MAVTDAELRLAHAEYEHELAVVMEALGELGGSLYVEPSEEAKATAAERIRRRPTASRAGAGRRSVR